MVQYLTQVFVACKGWQRKNDASYDLPVNRIHIGNQTVRRKMHEQHLRSCVRDHSVIDDASHLGSVALDVPSFDFLRRDKLQRPQTRGGSPGIGEIVSRSSRYDRTRGDGYSSRAEGAQRAIRSCVHGRVIVVSWYSVCEERSDSWHRT